jgi:predicted SAM-dependent methyltransferase
MHLPTRTLRRPWRAVERARTFHRCRRLPPGGRLHVGCGPLHLDGWINIDKFRSAATDHVVDVRFGIPFRELAFIFAEHFIEHLSYREIVNFLRDCRAALSATGVLRLSTPNLDWVYRTQYHLTEWQNEPERVRDCFALNKSFRGWGHQFLFNRATLHAMLRQAGFATIEDCSYGASRHSELAGLERHERNEDLPDAPHILIVEASGRRTEADPHLSAAADDFLSAADAR